MNARLRNIAVISVLALAGACVVGCDGAGVRQAGEASDRPWLQIEHETKVGGARLVVACDTLTGNRLYILGPGSDGKAVAIIPGGCR